MEFGTTIKLLREARDGQSRAVEELFTRYLPRVRQIVALRLGYPQRDFATYEDLVQESLLRVFEKLDTFEVRTEGTFYHWVATCVMTSINRHFRRQGAQKRGAGKVCRLDGNRSGGLTASVLAHGAPGPRTEAMARELEDTLEQALLRLKSHHREVIILRHLCAMSSTEIADTMGFASAATARKVLSRAMEALKTVLPENVASLA